MNDDTPAYMSNDDWSSLLHRLDRDTSYRKLLGIDLCPFTGRVEEYMVLDLFGGQLNLWPERFRGIIEADRAGNISKAA